MTYTTRKLASGKHAVFTSGGILVGNKTYDSEAEALVKAMQLNLRGEKKSAPPAPVRVEYKSAAGVTVQLTPDDISRVINTLAARFGIDPHLRDMLAQRLGLPDLLDILKQRAGDTAYHAAVDAMLRADDKRAKVIEMQAARKSFPGMFTLGDDGTAARQRERAQVKHAMPGLFKRGNTR